MSWNSLTDIRRTSTLRKESFSLISFTERWLMEEMLSFAPDAVLSMTRMLLLVIRSQDSKSILTNWPRDTGTTGSTSTYTWERRRSPKPILQKKISLNGTSPSMKSTKQQASPGTIMDRRSSMGGLVPITNNQHWDYIQKEDTGRDSNEEVSPEEC